MSTALYYKKVPWMATCEIIKNNSDTQKCVYYVYTHKRVPCMETCKGIKNNSDTQVLQFLFCKEAASLYSWG